MVFANGTLSEISKNLVVSEEILELQEEAVQS